MTREEEEIAVAFNDYRDALKLSTFGDFEYIDIQEAFEEGAKWADKTIIDKACEYAKARYDLDYCGNVMDILNYLKSLVEE